MHRSETDSADRSTDEASTATHRVALFSLPAYGHVNPTLRTARELVEHGHDVAYYLPGRFAEVVEPTGATFERLDDDYDLMARIDTGNADVDSDDDAEGCREHLVRFMRERLDAVPSLVDRVAGDGADAVVTDPMCLWGRVVADELDAPTVSFNTSFAMRKGSPLIENIRSSDGGGTPLPGAITDVLASMDIDDPDPSDFFVADADRSIVPLTRGFQPDADSFGDDHAFVGPMVRAGGEQRTAGLPLDRLTERSSVYISLGTVVHGDDDFFETCIEAFDDGDWEVVLKAKGDAERFNAESPENVHVRSRVPQLDVLERVDVFVTHGGMNSTMESLSLGTPPVVVPQMADQHLVAERVETVEVGIALGREDPTAADLRDAVETVSAAAYYGAVEEFNASVRAAGGAEQAADVVEGAVDS
jgi:MGT family glycosyltransferase